MTKKLDELVYTNNKLWVIKGLQASQDEATYGQNSCYMNVNTQGVV